MGERKRRGTHVWFYILRPFSFSDCTWMLGLHQDCNRIVDCSLCLLWLHCDVEIEPGLHGAGKSTVFECLALAESWVLHRDCRITMDCRTFAILFLVLLSFRFFFRLNCGGIAWRFGDWTRMLRIAQRRRLDCRLYSYCRLHFYLCAILW